jgi:hypothetical protein
MTLDEGGKRLWSRFSPQQRWSFFSCLITGLLVHLYAFTNLIPNSDGLSRVYDLQQMTVSGRWFLHYASALNNFTQMPMAIGLVSVLLLSVAAGFAADLLGLRSKVAAGLAGAILAAFPCMGYTYLYLFTAAAYSLAILLAVLSVWLAKKGGWKGVLGIIPLALSMGIYQAYLCLALSLALLVVLGDVLNPRCTWRKALARGLFLLFTLVVGVILYAIVLKIFLWAKDLTLLTYLGMDQVESGYPWSSLPSLIFSIYSQVGSFFFQAGSANGFATGWMVALDWVAVALTLGMMGYYLWASGLWISVKRLSGCLAVLLLLPLAMDFVQLVSPYSTPTPLMKYGFVSFYLLVLQCVDRGERVKKKSPRGVAQVTALWAAALLLFSLNTNNLLYTASAQAHRATESYLTRLMTRIEECDGYETGMEVVIIGAIPYDQLTASVESYAQVNHYSVPRRTVATLNKHIYYYLSDWLNIPVEEPSEETMMEVSQSEEFAEMPLYPDSGSIQVLDGRLVVKLQETYTPKEDYEIAYENRR